MQVPEDEKFLKTRDELHDDIVVTLGGRAAEEVIFNTVTTGAENDIEKATATVRDMITLYGMSEKFGLMQLETIQSRYLDGRREMVCSEQTASEVDNEVREYLAKCYEEAKSILRAHLDTMDKLAQHLIEKETITGKEFMRIYRDAEGIPEPTEEEKEKAKSRIWATRPESAAVGENVPVKDAGSSKPTFEASVGGPAGTNNPGGIHYEDPAREFTTLFPHDENGQGTSQNYSRQGQAQPADSQNAGNAAPNCNQPAQTPVNPQPSGYTAPGYTQQNQAPLSGQSGQMPGQLYGQSAQQAQVVDQQAAMAGQQAEGRIQVDAQTYGQQGQVSAAGAQTYEQAVQKSTPAADAQPANKTGGDEPGRFSNATGLFDD